jgi:uncharacterized membrane protein YwzB
MTEQAKVAIVFVALALGAVVAILIAQALK